MNTPLTDLQRELLSASLDGEINDAERASVAELLKRDDAQAYLESLRATASLVSGHAALRAPVGLSGRVLNALENEFKPKAVGPGSEPFTAIPILSWRAPLYAAAAAILVALGIMFGPALLTPAGTGDVARTPLDNLPTKDARPASSLTEDERLPDERLPKETLENALENALEKKPDGTNEADSPADFAMRRAQADNKKHWGPAEDPQASDRDRKAGKELAEGTAEPEKSGKEDSEKLKDAGQDLKRAGSNSADLGKSKEDARGNSRDELDGESRPAQGADTGGGSGAGRSSPGAAGGKKGEGEARNDGDDKVAAPKPAAPSEPPRAESLDAAESETGMTIEISDARKGAAQTDVLWISNLYGEAELTDDENESVAVEVDADKVDELLAALRKLARDQGYGEVGGPAAAKPQGGETIKGYLPSDERQAAESVPKAEAAKAEKVRVVIRLK